MGQITRPRWSKFVKAGVPAGKQHVSLRDGSGLVLRLLPSGHATWLSSTGGLARAAPVGNAC